MTLCVVVFTVKGVQSFAVSNDGQRVVVIELVIKLVRVGVWLSGLWRTGAVMRCVMLLIGVVCVTALRADGKQEAGVNLLTYSIDPTYKRRFP